MVLEACRGCTLIFRILSLSSFSLVCPIMDRNKSGTNFMNIIFVFSENFDMILTQHGANFVIVDNLF